MPMIKSILPLLLAGSFVLLSGQPLQVRDALGILEVANRSPVGLSPDGQWVAYTVEDLRRHPGTNDPLYRAFSPTGAFQEAAGCDVWVANVQSGEALNLTGGLGYNWGPVWSPDSRWLAFYSDRGGLLHLWLWDPATRKLKQLSDAVPHTFFNFSIPAWTPDSRRVLIKALPEGMTVEQAARLALAPAAASSAANPFGAHVSVYRSKPGNEPARSAPPAASSGAIQDQRFLNQYRADLALIDVATGQVHRIATGVRPLGYWISPDGAQVAFTDARGMEEHTQQGVFSLDVVPVGGGQSRALAPEVKQEYGISVRWSPDSRSLAYTTYGQTAKGNCYVVSLDGGAVTNLTPGSHSPLGSAYNPPYWDRAGDAIYLVSAGKVWKVSVKGRSLSPFVTIPDHSVMEIVAPQAGGPPWSPDGDSEMVVMARNTRNYDAGFFRIDRAGNSHPVFESPILLRGIFDVDASPAGGMVYIRQDASTPDEIWIDRDDLRSQAPLAKLNPQLGHMVFGKSRLIDWRSIDGRRLRGALLLPAGYEPGKRYPLIVNVYGGSDLSESVHRFGLRGSGVDNMQILATRGYAVLLPDAPLHVGSPMRDLLKDVLPGVDRAVELGIADPKRLGVMGHSYGGYSTLSLIVQTTRFQAAVDSAGIADLISFYGQMDPSGSSFALGWAESGQGRMDATPWERRDRYIANSPLFFLDRVQTPLLIVQGQLDHAVPQEQGDEAFIALQRLGKEVEYAKYADEDHWEGTWSMPDMLDYWNRVIHWFDGHLKPSSGE
jgi:dipeptidyl aminopeptidase/acylaminoacyl peptidase